MTTIIYPANAADWVLSPTFHGNILELGNSGTYDDVGAVVVQFSPDAEFVGEVIVMGRARYQTDTAATALPFLPVAYIAVNVNGAADLRTLTVAPISQPGIIEIPANGLSAGLMLSCSAGTCRIGILRLRGTVNGFIPASV